MQTSKKENAEQEPINQKCLQEVLRAEFSLLKQRRSHLSIRAFSRKAKISPSAMSEILRGKRRVSERIALRILKNLGVEAKDHKKVFQHANKPGNAIRDQMLTADEFDLISKWQHFAILSLAETQDFRPEIKWMASRLGQPAQTIKQCTARLLRLGLLEGDQQNFYASGIQLKTSEDIPSSAIQLAHIEDLLMAQEKIESLGTEERDFSSTTISVSKNSLKNAKELIREFRKRFREAIYDSEGDEVFKLCLQYFPLSKRESDTVQKNGRWKKK